MEPYNPSDLLTYKKTAYDDPEKYYPDWQKISLIDHEVPEKFLVDHLLKNDARIYSALAMAINHKENNGKGHPLLIRS